MKRYRHNDLIPHKIWFEHNLWTRSCPDCSALIQSKNFQYLAESIYKNRKCKSCATKGQLPWNTGLTKFTDIRLESSGKKISTTKKENFKSGKSIPWGLGLTKETNDSLKKLSESAKLRTHSDQTKIKIGLKSAERWKDPVFREKMIPHMHDMLKLNKNSNTKPELAVIEILKELNVEYIHQFTIKSDFGGKLTTRFYDIYLPKFNKFIEVHGDYWHGYNIKENDLNAHQQKSALRDFYKIQIAYLNNIEYNVIWEYETKNKSNLILKIEQILYSPRPLITNPFYNFKPWNHD